MFKLDELLITVKMEQYFETIMHKANEAGMLVIYDNDAKYILVIKYWDSASGKVCGSKYQIAGEFNQGFLKFKRFLFDSTFDNIFLFVVNGGELYRSHYKNTSNERYLFGGKNRFGNGLIESFLNKSLVG